MAAQPHFAGGREPAQFPVGFTAGIAHHEGGFREQVLRPDCQQYLVRQPGIEHHDRRLVATERAVGEGIDMPVGDCTHPPVPSLP